MKKSLPLLSLLTVGLIFGGPVDSVKTSALAANHGKKVSWNLSTWGKRRAFTEGIEAVSAYVADKSDGHFTIKINYGGTLSKPRENLDGISLGAFEAATFCASYHADKNKAVTVLELPFLPITLPRSPSPTVNSYISVLSPSTNVTFTSSGLSTIAFTISSNSSFILFYL